MLRCASSSILALNTEHFILFVIFILHSFKSKTGRNPSFPGVSSGAAQWQDTAARKASTVCRVDIVKHARSRGVRTQRLVLRWSYVRYGCIMGALWIVEVFELRGTVAVQSNRTIYLLSNCWQVGFGEPIAVPTLVADLDVGVTQWFRLAYRQTPRRRGWHKDVRVHRRSQWVGAVTLENLTIGEWTISNIGIRESSCGESWSGTCQWCIVVVHLIGKSFFAKCVTVGFLFHFPIVFLNCSTGSVLAFYTYSVFEPGINVLLWFNFPSWIYCEVSSSISWTTSLNFNGTSSRCSTHGNIRVCEENRISAGNGNQSSRINISYFLVGMHNCL